jgi:Tol biopolymer transport system component
VPTPRWPWLAAAGLLVVGGAAAWLVLGGDDDDEIAIAVTSSRRLTFDPGCEEYPHLHPDGRRVVYDGLVGNDYELMQLDVETGEKQQLTETPGWDYASSLSPDGTKVAYVHEDTATRTLRVLDLASKTSRDLGAIHGYPSWTAEGALLVGDVTGRIVRRELGGKDTLLGTLPAGARLYHLVEVRDAGIAMLWWTSSDADATALGELDRDGTLRVVEEIATDYEGGLTASPRGRGYYATRKGATEGNQLLFRRWGGGTPQIVPGGIAPGAGVDVTRDGRQLVFSTCVERQYIVRISHSGDTSPQIVSKGTWQDTNPFVVDGRHVIVTSDRSGQQHGWLLDLESSEPPRSLTPPGALGASPSPDGTQLVYATRGGRGGLAVVATTSGAAARTLTTDASDAAPVFAHGGHVVFERTVAGATHVYAIPAAGGVARDLALGAQPAASPVDGTLAFITAPDASGARRVMITDLAGAAPRDIPSLPAAAWQRPRFSADGRHLLLVRGFQELVIVAIDGSVPPRVVWRAGSGSVSTAAWTRDGRIVAAVGGYEGDLWLADGTFP